MTTSYEPPLSTGPGLVANNQPVQPPTPTAIDYIRAYVKRLRAGDIGSLPILFGIILVGIIFQVADSHFLTAHNMVNLILQMAGYTFLGYGIVFVLLLGEIDLSIGFVSAIVGVSVTVMLIPKNGLPWFLALPIGLLIGSAIGLLQGVIITFFQLPSFVVTLAGSLIWSGVVLLIIGNGGTVILQDPTIIGVTSAYLPPIAAWIAAVVLIIGFAAFRLSGLSSRRQQNLIVSPLPIVIIQVVLLAIAVLGIVYVANQDRGVPVVGILMVLFLFGLTFLAERTRFGRYVYAIGGNKEAARRAGIPVERYRVLVFMIASTMAGIGGVVLASRLRSVATDAGGGNLVLNSIAAAVIGGTSLFGGRGRISSALVGAIVVAGVENGMGLLGLSAGDKFIATGLVLLAAVVIDSISRRNQKRAGLT